MPSSSLVTRHPRNPLIRPAEVKPSGPEMEVLGVFNPGAVLYGNKRLLLARVAERPIPEKGYVSTVTLTPEGEPHILRVRHDDPELDFRDPRLFTYRGQTYVTSMSHFRRAEAGDDLVFHLDDSPTLRPSGPYESYGIEDARITEIEGAFYVNYTAASPYGVTTALARTEDFVSFERLGIMFGPDNKDVVIFPEKIGGRFHALHRPANKHFGPLAIWLASSDNLRDWGRHHHILSPRPGHWDGERVGAGAAPIRTREGWLEIYHASDASTRYCSGALLLDLENPAKILARSAEPFFFPEAPYETHGFMPNVVFQSGLIQTSGDELELYYGAADDTIAMATISVRSILSSLGRPLRSFSPAE